MRQGVYNVYVDGMELGGGRILQELVHMQHGWI